MGRGESVKWARSVNVLAEAGADPIDQIKEMPPGLFVWADDLRDLVREVNDALTQDPPYGPSAPAVEVNCCPLLTEQEDQLVLEGFDWAVPAPAPQPEVPGVNGRAARQELSGAPASMGVPAGAEDLEIPTRVTVERKATPGQRDRLICQVLAKRYWKKDPGLKAAEILRMPEFKKYCDRYRDRKTLPGFIRDVDPRPKETRRGRRKKR